MAGVICLVSALTAFKTFTHVLELVRNSNLEFLVLAGSHRIECSLSKLDFFGATSIVLPSAKGRSSVIFHSLCVLTVLGPFKEEGSFLILVSCLVRRVSKIVFLKVGSESRLCFELHIVTSNS